MAKPVHRTLRERRAHKRREELLAASLKLFAERGFHATSIRDIARAVGITEGLIYHYFRSKEALLKGVVEHSLTGRDPHGFEKFPDDLPIDEALRRLGKTLLGRLRSNKEIFRLMVSESRLFERNGDLFYPKMIYDTGMRRMGAFLASRMDAGELRQVDPVLAARQFTGSLVAFFIFQEILLGKRVVHVDPEAFLEMTIDIFLNGIEKKQVKAKEYVSRKT
jgi:AcrR family transcriptional regulator